MCFSATASFSAGTVLLGLGTLALKSADRPRELMFAAIPLLFAIQQLTKGVIWLTFRYDAPQINRVRRRFMHSFHTCCGQPGSRVQTHGGVQQQRPHDRARRAQRSRHVRTGRFRAGHSIARSAASGCIRARGIHHVCRVQSRDAGRQRLALFYGIAGKKSLHESSWAQG